jgi:hypothetical protein
MCVALARLFFDILQWEGREEGSAAAKAAYEPAEESKDALTLPSPIGWARVALRPGEGRFSPQNMQVHATWRSRAAAVNRELVVLVEIPCRGHSDYR